MATNRHLLVSDANAYPCKTLNNFPYSFALFLSNCFRLTGSGWNNSSTRTVVPTDRAQISSVSMLPFLSNVTLSPLSSLAVLVVTTNRLHVPHSDDNASPLKPNVPTFSKSLNSRSFDVAYFCVKSGTSSLATPLPLSLTSTHSNPNSFTRISTFVAPASKLFSKSSFAHDATSKIT